MRIFFSSEFCELQETEKKQWWHWKWCHCTTGNDTVNDSVNDDSVNDDVEVMPEWIKTYFHKVCKLIFEAMFKELWICFKINFNVNNNLHKRRKLKTLSLRKSKNWDSFGFLFLFMSDPDHHFF